jgi:Putative abortive phage resistance protein AbiGi, antitoxin
MSAISDNLIHFLARNNKESPVKQLDVLKQIVENGLRTSRVQIKFDSGTSIINQIICFTDIPLRECNEHTSIYGKFGIGFKKSFVKNAGGNPARYFLDYLPGQTGTEAGVESRGGLYSVLCSQHKFLMKISELLKLNPDAGLFDAEGTSIFTAAELKEQVNEMIFILSYEKEMGDLGPARDETKEIDLYYKEREWRLVPSTLTLLSGAAKLKDGTSAYFYSFDRNDVNMIVVPNEELRTVVLNYFLSLSNSADERLKRFAENPLPVINYDDLHRW